MCRDETLALPPPSLAARRAAETPVPFAWESLEIKTQVPDNTKQLTITIFDPRQTLVKVLTEETSPAAGPRTFKWDFKTDDGKDAGIGHFMYRVSADGDATTGMVVRPGRTSPEELGAQVVAMIERYAPLAGVRTMNWCFPALTENRSR